MASTIRNFDPWIFPKMMCYCNLIRPLSNHPYYLGISYYIDLKVHMIHIYYSNNYTYVTVAIIPELFINQDCCYLLYSVIQK